jgi:hypothetical protein
MAGVHGEREVVNEHLLLVVFLVKFRKSVFQGPGRDR